MPNWPPSKQRDPVLLPMYIIAWVLIAATVAAYFVSIPLAVLATLLLWACGLPEALWESDRADARSTRSPRVLTRRENQLANSGEQDVVLVGSTGRTRSALRPAGVVTIADRYYDARAEFGFIDNDMEIVVIGTSSGVLVVQLAEPRNEDPRS